MNSSAEDKKLLCQWVEQNKGFLPKPTGGVAYFWCPGTRPSHWKRVAKMRLENGTHLRLYDQRHGVVKIKDRNIETTEVYEFPADLALVVGTNVTWIKYDEACDIFGRENIQMI